MSICASSRAPRGDRDGDPARDVNRPAPSIPTQDRAAPPGREPRWGGEGRSVTRRGCISLSILHVPGAPTPAPSQVVIPRRPRLGAPGELQLFFSIPRCSPWPILLATYSFRTAKNRGTPVIWSAWYDFWTITKAIMTIF